MNMMTDDAIHDFDDDDNDDNDNDNDRKTG
jgi:hypothetical protein